MLTTNSTIDDLTLQCVNYLENSTSNLNIVGNRMHYPMVITANGQNASNIKHIFSNYFRKIWPQTSENIVFVKNKFSDKKLELTDFQTDSAISQAELQDSLDKLSNQHGLFENFLNVCFYNIIDTSVLNTIDEFITHYNALYEFEKIISRPTQNMSIVLLDDTTKNQEFAYSIRSFLSENSIYKSNIIIAKRSISGELYSLDDLINVSASVIALSNNDAVSTDDDDDYNKRINMLYDGSTLTVAHSLLKRPNNKIALQMLDVLIEHCDNLLCNKPTTYTTTDWLKVLGIEQGTIQFFEKEMNLINLNFNFSEFKYLPYKKIPNATIDFDKMKFSQFSDYIFDESFEQYLQESCNSKLNLVNSLIEKYKLNIKTILPANQCVDLTDETIKNIMNNLSVKNPEKETVFSDYYTAKIKAIIREKYIYPQIKSFLNDLRICSKKTINDFSKLKNNFKVQLPLQGFDELGTYYSNMVEKYLNTQNGETKVTSIILPGNELNEFSNGLVQAFEQIIQIQKDKFQLSFIDEWVQRLNLTGDTVLRKIEKTFNEDFQRRLFLSGNYPKHKKIEIYIFHTYNSEKIPTKLFEYLTKTFSGVENIQFINSGCDDFVESIRFIDCSGRKLLL